ncbi:Bug family tripartite tricarboxylate transporter substrate binding protein [Chloroflexota bacterium]
MNAPGGGFDAYSRGVAHIMEKNHLPDGVNIIVKNVAGAGGRTGANLLARSKPDGYTIGLTDMEKLVGTQLVLGTSYDMRDFTFIGQISRSINGVCVSADSPWNNIDDIKAAALAKEGGLLVPADEPSPPDILPLRELGIPFRFILGYDGSAAAIASVLAGEGDLCGYPITSMLPWVKSGDLKPIFVLDSEPDPFYEELGLDVPTISDLGYPELAVLGGPRLVAMPPETPSEIASYFEKVLMQTLQDPELIEWSVKAERNLIPGDAAYALEAMEKTLALYDKYKDDIAEYYQG